MVFSTTGSFDVLPCTGWVFFLNLEILLLLFISYIIALPSFREQCSEVSSLAYFLGPLLAGKYICWFNSWDILFFWEILKLNCVLCNLNTYCNTLSKFAKVLTPSLSHNNWHGCQPRGTADLREGWLLFRGILTGCPQNVHSWWNLSLNIRITSCLKIAPLSHQRPTSRCAVFNT